MARYSEEILNEIRQSNDIVDVISQYVHLKRSGRNYFGLCPFHNEKSPSFSVSPDKQIFHCFGCGVGGNVITFVSQIEGLNFVETVQMLAERANIQLPTLQNNGDTQREILKDKVYKVNEFTAEYYHQNLYKPQAKMAQEYVKKRQLTNETLKSFRIGFSGKFDELYQELKKQSYALYDKILEKSDVIKTKDIGDMGESLVHSHECQRVKIGGREDLIHLIKRIPTQFAVGYDIQSVELDERKRYIEVKTTISSKPLHFNKVHLTPNEWNTANTMRDRYFVYRLMISKTEKKLFLIQDPVGLYKRDLIDMIPKDGADITFSTTRAEVGNFEELLTWTN